MKKLKIPEGEGIYRIKKGEKIYGKSLQAFVRNGNKYYLTEIKIYSDEMIDCWGLISVDDFKNKIEEGCVVTSIPRGSEIKIHFLGDCVTNRDLDWINESEFIKEVGDVIKELNGQKTTSDLCKEAYMNYLNKPSVTTKQCLRSTYESVPKHNRLYILGDQDHKDYAIRTIICGKDL